jgi:hypothetical protein
LPKMHKIKICTAENAKSAEKRCKCLKLKT